MVSDNLFAFNKSGVPLVILGLPQAGKTTFVRRLISGKFSRPKPTLGVQYERVNIKDVSFNIFDLGGQEKLRETLWKNYIKLSFGIVFIIDSANIKLLPDVKREFWNCVNQKSKNNEFLILFLCNKSDLKNAADLEMLIEALDLYKLSSLNNVTFQFFKTSMKTGENLDHALSWLHNKTYKIIAKKQITPLMFLVAQRDGLPILSIDRKDAKRDPFLVSGFLSAIESFSREVFEHVGVLQFLMEDDYKYVILSTENNIYATLIGKDESQEEARRLIEIVNAYFVKEKSLVSLESFILAALNVDKSQYEVNRAYEVKEVGSDPSLDTK